MTQINIDPRRKALPSSSRYPTSLAPSRTEARVPEAQRSLIMQKISRRNLIAGALSLSAATVFAHRSCADPAKRETTSPTNKLHLGVPLTHSDWMLKPGIPRGPTGVHHMLDTCKACGWSNIYWRALDGGRALYRSKLLAPGGQWDADSYWSPQTDADRALFARFRQHVRPKA